MNALVIGVGHWAGLFIWSGANIPSGFLEHHPTQHQYLFDGGRR